MSTLGPVDHITRPPLLSAHRWCVMSSPSTWSLSPGELAHLAAQLTDEWAESRVTQATLAERDLALWIMEWLAAHVDLGGVAELGGAQEALESWVGVPR